jgi:hypothetical protein
VKYREENFEPDKDRIKNVIKTAAESMKPSSRFWYDEKDYEFQE